MFEIGNRVIRRNKPEAIGKVVNVIADIRRTPELTIYDVEFPSDRAMLHGYELRALYPACKEWRRLSELCRKSAEIYFTIVVELADAAGTIAHTEFELLRGRAEAARELSRVAHDRVEQHSAKHGC